MPRPHIFVGQIKKIICTLNYVCPTMFFNGLLHGMSKRIEHARLTLLMKTFGEEQRGLKISDHQTSKEEQCGPNDSPSRLLVMSNVNRMTQHQIIR